MEQSEQEQSQTVNRLGWHWIRAVTRPQWHETGYSANNEEVVAETSSSGSSSAAAGAGVEEDMPTDNCERRCAGRYRRTIQKLLAFQQTVLWLQRRARRTRLSAMIESTKDERRTKMRNENPDVLAFRRDIWIPRPTQITGVSSLSRSFVFLLLACFCRLPPPSR